MLRIILVIFIAKERGSPQKEFAVINLKVIFAEKKFFLKLNFVSSLFVINSKGERELFSESKIYRSAKRAGASSAVARRIAQNIREEAYPGIKTLIIFGKIKNLLRKKLPGAALRFNIKEGMRRLGPTGFPFEKYVKNILESLGYQVEINLFLPGKCLANYEIDFVAKRGKLIYVGECKYRQRLGETISYHDALANYARFLDISNSGYFKSDKNKGFTVKAMLVTNTKFNNRTRDYCSCIGTELLGWNYPKNRGLEYFVDKERLYPITILPALKGYLKDVFVKEKLILAKNLLEIDVQEFAQKNNLSLKQLEILVGQAEILLQ